MGKYVLKYIDESKLKYWPTPAESPDLNPIEMIWKQLKHHLRKNVKPKTQDELVKRIQEYWKTVTPELCKKYINHLQKSYQWSSNGVDELPDIETTVTTTSPKSYTIIKMPPNLQKDIRS